MRNLTAALIMFGFAAPALAAQPSVVIELYTSQGCNSCPPADALLGELAGRPDLLALSFHVDYWDYIGWKDTFATPAFTARQRTYQQVLGGRYVYTPQAIVAGTADAVGSDRGAVQRLIEGAKRPSLALRYRDGRMAIPGGVGAPATVYFLRYDPAHEVAVGRGENAGHTLAYRNVVREWRSLGAWTGKALDLAVEAKPGDSAAVIVQKDGPGPVLGLYAFDRLD